MSDRTYRVRLEAALGSFRRDMEAAATSTRNVGKAATSAADEQVKAHDKQRRSLTTWLSANEEAFGAFERSGKAMMAGITLPMVALGTAVAATGVAYNDLEQRSRQALTTILGSAEAASAQMEALVAFGRESPFPRQVWIEAQQQLLGFGMEAERVIPILNAVQDAVAATGGTSQDISEIVDVLARIEGQGRITGVEIQRLGIRGIDAVGMIADAAGVTGDEIRTAISSGAVDADMALDALVAGIDEKMGGAAQGLRDTWTGAVDRVKGAFRDLSSAIMEPFVGTEGGGSATVAANTMADSMRTLEAAYRDMSPAAQTAAIGTSALVAGLPVGIYAVGRLGRAAISTAENLRAMRPALSATAGVLTGPWGIAIAAAGASLWAFTRRSREVQDTVSTLRVELNGAAADFEGLSDAMLLRELGDAGALEAFRRTGLGLDDLRTALTGTETEYRAFQQAVSDSSLADEWNTFGALASDLSFGLIGTEQGLNAVLDTTGVLREGTQAYNEQLATERELAGATAEQLDELAGMTGAAAHEQAMALDPTGELAAGLGLLGENAAEAQGPLAQLGYDLEQLGVVTEDAAQEWVDLAGQFLDAGQAMTRANDENRAAAEEAAEAHNAAIDDQIAKLGEGEEAARDSLEGQRRTWEDFADDFPATIGQVTGHLEDVNAEFRTWQGDIQTIAQEVGGDVATRLAMMGPEWAPIVAQAVDATASEIAALDQALVDNLDLQMAAAEMAVQMEIFTEIARQGGRAAVDSFAESTGIATDVIEDIWSALDLDPIDLAADATQTFFELDRADQAARAWADGRFVAWVDANIDPADRKFYTLDTLLRAYQESDPTASLFADDGPARSTLSGFDVYADQVTRDRAIGLTADASRAISVLDDFMQRLQAAGFTRGEAAWSARLTAQAGAMPQGDGPGAGGGGSALARARRAMSGVPGVRVTSTYRSPARNRAVGGSPTSYHMDRSNPATDIGGPTSSLDVVHARLRAMGGNRELIWRAPGHYDHVHVAHDGGEVSPGWPTVPGLRPDERPAVLQLGEEVLARREAAAYRQALAAVPRHHTGTVRSSTAVGSDLSRLERAIEDLARQVARQATRRQVAGMKQDVFDARDDVKSAKTSEERARAREREAEASKRYNEFLADEAVKTREIEHALKKARLEAELRVATNRESWLFDRMSTAQQLRDLERRLGAEQRFHDTWMQIDGQRQQILDRQADEARRRHDETLSDLNRSLDARESAYARHDQTVAAARQRAADAERTAAAQRADQLRQQLSLDQGDDAWNWTARSIAAAARRQADEVAAYETARAEARARGVSDDALAALGINGPEALAQLKVLLRSSDDELAEMSDAVAARAAAIADQVSREMGQAHSDLGREIREIRDGLTSDLAAAATELADDLADIGNDGGRSWAEAIAEGIASGLPAIRAQVAAVQAAMREVKGAEAAAAAPAPAKASRADQIRALFDRYGVKYGRHADGSWEDPETRIARLAAGGRSLPDLERSIRNLPRFHDGGFTDWPASEERLALLRGQELVTPTDGRREVIGTASLQPKVVVVEKVVERIPDGVHLALDVPELGGSFVATIRAEQSAHDGRMTAATQTAHRQRVR